MSTRPEVQVIKFKDKTRDEAYDDLDDILIDIRNNFRQTNKFTVLHCYLSVSQENMKLDRRGQIEIKMKHNSYFPIQKTLTGFKSNRQVLWAVFDCDRDNTRVTRTMGGAAGGDQQWPDSDEEDKEFA